MFELNSETIRRYDATDLTFGLLSGEDPSERACDAISEDQCIEVPGNYVRNVANGACTKLAEQLAGSNLVLPWLLAAVGSPAAIIGFLAPVRQAGALLPQLAVSAVIRRLPERKWVWAAAGALQAVCLIAMMPAALALPPIGAGLAVLGLLAVFSIASGTGSVAFQDVMAKTIPKGQRGRLLGSRAMIGGALTVVAGALLYLLLGDSAGAPMYAVLIGCAGLLWAMAVLLFAQIREQSGATEGGRNALGEARRGLRFWHEAPDYRRYLIARALLVTVEVAAPFYALYAREHFGGTVGALGIYVLAIGVGSVVSSPFWGRLSDLSARRSMMLAGAMAAGLALFALVLSQLPQGPHSRWLFGLVFVGLGIAESGARLGRKTYLVDAVPGGERPLYVAFANTAIGLVTLAWGLLGIVPQAFGLAAVIALLVLLHTAGVIAAARMPEAGAFRTPDAQA